MDFGDVCMSGVRRLGGERIDGPPLSEGGDISSGHYSRGPSRGNQTQSTELGQGGTAVTKLKVSLIYCSSQIVRAEILRCAESVRLCMIKRIRCSAVDGDCAEGLGM